MSYNRLPGHFPYYKAFKEGPDGEVVWLTRDERLRMWLGDCCHAIGLALIKRAEQLWKSVH